MIGQQGDALRKGRYVSGTDAARAAGISYRQLDYWCRTGVIKPELDASGSGAWRGFTPRQVDVLRCLGDLVRDHATVFGRSDGIGVLSLADAAEWLYTRGRWELVAPTITIRLVLP